MNKKKRVLYNDYKGNKNEIIDNIKTNYIKTFTFCNLLLILIIS